MRLRALLSLCLLLLWVSPDPAPAAAGEPIPVFVSITPLKCFWEKNLRDQAEKFKQALAGKPSAPSPK